jgi:hypothetical protein
MTNEILTQPTNEPALVNAKLEDLAARANDAHQRVKKAACEGLLAAFEAGQALLQAQKTCLGQWLAWLGQNFKGSYRTAQRYMEFAEECHSLGGFDATRVSRLPPQELGHIWSQILGRQPHKKRPSRLPAASPSAAPAHGRKSVADDADAPLVADGGGEVPATASEAPQQPESCHAAVDPMPRLVTLFAQLVEGFRSVCAGDDCHDGPYAEMMLVDLEANYTDLLEYMEYRQEWRSKPGHGNDC